MKTKIFFDCEFTWLHQWTTLISIWFISECWKTFYAEYINYDKNQIDDWLKENVINKLRYNNIKNNSIVSPLLENYRIKGNSANIKKCLIKWLNQFKQVEIWSDCLAYDWVLFNNIFWHAFDIPKNVYYIPFDICTLFKIKWIDPDISREEFVKDCQGNWFPEEEKHNALYDAKIIRLCYNKLIT